jgi:uncharacterized protein
MINIFALSDLHLSFATPEKDMQRFGPRWSNYAVRIKKHWIDIVSEDDYVLVGGDISWASQLDEAKQDLDWIGALPGKKLMIKGNHDYWWGTVKKMRDRCHPSMDFLRNSITWIGGPPGTEGAISVIGIRMWDIPNLNYMDCIDWIGDKPEYQYKQHDRQIFDKDLFKLERMLRFNKQNGHNTDIVLMHYPPIHPAGRSTIVSDMLSEYGVKVCIYGHVHGLTDGVTMNHDLNGVRYIFTSGDYCDFKPQHIVSCETSVHQHIQVK